jgi:hypothetical protein
MAIVVRWPKLQNISSVAVTIFLVTPQPLIVFSQSRGDIVQGSTERWMKLCAEAANEKDPDKFLELIKEINDLLEAKRLRFSGKKADSQPSDD